MVQGLQVDRQLTQPLHRQLYQELRRRILSGEIAPGAKLPPGRQLARDVQVSRVTVTQAMTQLAVEGYVEMRPGAGTFVVEELQVSATGFGESDPYIPAFAEWGERVMGMGQAVDLYPGLPVPARRPTLRADTAVSGDIDFGFGRTFTHIFPYDVWRRLLARYLSTDDIILARYGSVAGFYPLRQALAAHLVQVRGLRCTPEQVVIVSGAQQTLDILCRLLLQRGDTVLVETPGYRDAYNLFRVNGARLVALPVDDQGFPVEHIPADTAARLLFVTPSNQFPRGGTMPLARRLALLQWARAHDALIVEDDYDGELRYDNHPLAALQGLDQDGRVIYLGTFSKVLFPALRLAYVVLPTALVTPFVQAKRLVDRGAPTLTQAAVADFIAEGHFERHLRHLRKAYGEKRAALMTALQHHLADRVRFAPTAAGLHVMLYLDRACDETAVVRQARQQGVRVYPGAPYHMQQSAPPSILLGFSGLTEAEIEEGIRRLAGVLNEPCE